jgi:hypothetical protein
VRPNCTSSRPGCEAGQLNKARRGELEMGPPVGLMYRADGVLDLDPDAEVQAAIRLLIPGMSPGHSEIMSPGVPT